MHADAFLNLVALLDFFPSLPLSGVHGLGKGGELVVYADVLQVSPIGLQAHVQRDCVAFRIFPVRDARWHLPILLVFRRNLARR